MRSLLLWKKDSWIFQRFEWNTWIFQSMVLSVAVFNRFDQFPKCFKWCCLLQQFFKNLNEFCEIFNVSVFWSSSSWILWWFLKITRIFKVSSSALSSSSIFKALYALLWHVSFLHWSFEHMSGQLPRGSFLRGSFESMTDNSPSVVKSLCQNSLKVHEALRYLRIVLLSSLCEEAYYCSSDTMINSEARDAERKE